MTARVELTAQATADVSATMERLSVSHGEKGCADLCFATSMIEVGLDINRLGLLTMFGQPKSASQYIQVAGRVGRDERDAPGVVFVVLSPYNNRDRSHFEQFSTFHRRLYASVEPVSITPFTPAALDRGLAGALTAWIRQAVNPSSPSAAVDHFVDALVPIEARVRSDSPQERNLARRAAELNRWLANTQHAEWGTLQPGKGSTGFLRPLGEDAPARADNPDAVNTTWLVPTSMRSVDAEAGARAIRHTRTAGASSEATAPTAAGATGSAEEDVF